jgi:tRNA nucleotidyltransferase (CCA-adding enzyme)
MNLKNILQKKLYFPLLEEISEIANREKFSIFLVGGIVRDLLLGRENVDLDITVEKNGLEFAEILQKELKGVLKKFPKFGTSFLILPDKTRIDISTARKESYPLPAVLPEVEFSNIKEDLKRRDFTINSLAVSLNKDSFGELIDYFGGFSDLKKGIIRVIHNLSFVDDPTRIFRAIRFEQRYNFKIDGNTIYLIKKAVEENLISLLSSERLKNELLYIFKEEKPKNCIVRMAELNVLKGIHPDISLNIEELKNIEEIKNINMKNFKFDKNFFYFLVIFQNLDSKSIKEISERLKFSKKEIKNLLLSNSGIFKNIETKLKNAKIKNSEIYHLLKDIPSEILVLFYVKSKDESAKLKIKYYIENLSKLKTSISGKDLLKLGYKEGPLIKQVLEEVLSKKIDGEIKTKKDEIEYVKRRKNERDCEKY